MLKGLVCAVISACCYGCLPILGKLGYAHGMELTEMLAYRFGFGALFLGAWLALTDARALRIRPRTLTKAVAVGLFIYPLQSTCYLSSVKTISASTAALIVYFYPICVTLLSALIFRTRVGRTVMLSLALVTGGCALVFYDAFAQQADPVGMAFATGAMAVLSIYFIVSQKILTDEPPLTVGFYVILTTATVFWVVGGPPDVPGLDQPRALVAVGLGLIPTALAVSLLYKAIEAIGSALSSIFSTIEPITTVVLSFLVLGEAVAAVQLAGAALIILGIALPNLGLLRKKAVVEAAG